MEMMCSNDIKALLQNGGGAHVSIFMPAHHRGGIDQQDPIRLRNLLRNAEEKLIARGLRPTEARSMLKPVETLLTDNLFWRQQNDGLALFIEPNQYFYYRLPVTLREEVGAGDRFQVRPLVSLLSNCGLFYILALSHDENRLLQCTQANSVHIRLEGTPKDMSGALHYEAPDNRIQYHVPAPAEDSNFGGATAVQTGEQSRRNYNKRNIMQYFEIVNKSVMKYMKEETAPMFLAAVDYLHSLYHSANTYRNLLPEGILGNPDGVNDDTLREQAWKIVQPYFDKTRRDALADLQKGIGTGQSHVDLREVLIAAHQGRIRFLFLTEGSQQWGHFHTDTNTLTTHSKAENNDEDLIDLAAYRTLKHAGSIYLLKPEEMPAKTPIAAILRF
jgi:hypothetical protein